MIEPRRAVVTGVTGCVGQALVPALARHGWTVRGLVRSVHPGAPPPLEELHIGDLADPASLRGLCDGADLVIHAGGLVGDWGPSDTFWRINRDGTRALLEEAVRAGVDRFIYVGTANVFGFRADIVVDELTPKSPSPFPYPQSKLETEKLVWSYRDTGIGITVVYPTWVFGPGDRHLVPEMVERLRRRQLVYLGRAPAPLEVTYSENLAEGIVLMAQSAAARGEGYIVGDGFGSTLAGFIEGLAAAAGLQPPRFSVPLPVAYGLGLASERLATATRSRTRPLLTRYAVRSLATGVRFDLRKIRSLGYDPKIGLAEGLRRAVASLGGESAG